MNEAELVLGHALKCSRTYLYLNRDRKLGKDNGLFVSRVLKRRVCGQPLAYILGQTEFMGLEFKISPGVFIPRAETEVLVEAVLNEVRARKPSDLANLRLLEIGTGSGCIAVSLAKFLPGVKIEATDISEKALGLARDNSRKNGVNINFIKSDIFACGLLAGKTYDLIVSNPPYIADTEIGKLQPEIQCEPLIALDGGNKGLGFLRRIIAGSHRFLKDDGLLILEIGYNQKDAVVDLVRESAKFSVLKVIKDYLGIERVIINRLNLR